MTTPATLWKISTHWASRFGCPVELLDGPLILAVAHAALNRWNGVYLFQHHEACILSAPPELVDSLRRHLEGKALAEVFSSDFVHAALGDRVERIIGPAWLGYADARDFHPVDSSGVRLLTDDDAPALLALAGAAGEEWEHSGIQLGRPPIYGRYVEDMLVAAGTLEYTSPDILNVGIVTHPEHRSRGNARAVVSAMTAEGLQRGKVMQYRTLETNGPSLRIARQLGYQQYGATIAARLTEELAEESVPAAECASSTLPTSD